MARKAFFCAEQPQTHFIPVSSTPFSMTVMLLVISQMEMLGLFLFLMLPSDDLYLILDSSWQHWQTKIPMFSLPVCLCLSTETASLLLGKDPRVFSKRLLHIINKNVKVRVFPVLATASIFPVVISQFYTRS